MNHQVQEIKEINWSRGLHRVFAIAWVLWVAYIFFWIPLDIIHARQEYAASSYGYDSKSMSVEEKKAEFDANWERATWSRVYQDEIIKNIWSVLGVATLVPLAVYLLIRGFVMLVFWLYRGFRTK